MDEYWSVSNRSAVAFEELQHWLVQMQKELEKERPSKEMRRRWRQQERRKNRSLRR